MLRKYNTSYMFVQEKLLTILLVEKTAFAFILGLFARFTCTFVLSISFPSPTLGVSADKLSLLNTFSLF